MATDPTHRSSPREAVAHLMDGYLATQLLYVAVKLRIPDALATGPRTVIALADGAGTAPEVTRRILRGLAALGVLDEQDDGRYGLAPLGDVLRDGVPGSLRGAVIARGDLYYRAAGELLDSVRTGGVAFERAYGEPFFAHLQQHPDRGAVFQASMADRSRHEAAEVVASWDFSRFTRLVDVGGGTGNLLAAILTTTPRLHGVLFDLPDVVARAQERLMGIDVADRCTCVGGDFFVDDLPTGDAYLLSRVIHDWDDAAAGRILANCHRAMTDGQTLFLVEAVLPERTVDNSVVTSMDLHMLLLFPGARERTEAEFAAMLASAGFGIERVVPTRSPTALAVIQAVRRPS